MPTLTRLALGASAVSALTVFGTALPAAAQTPTSPTPRAPATHATNGTAARPAAARTNAGTSNASRTTGTHARTTHARTTHARTTHAAHSTTAHTTAARLRPSKKSRAELAQDARNARRSLVLHALSAQRRADARAAAGRNTASRNTASRTTASRNTTRTASRRTPTHPRVTGGRTSANWSGYTQSARDVGRPVTSVSAAWQVPRAKQHTRGQAEVASDWIGIGGTRSGGVSDPTLIQAGTTSTVGRAGTANHYAWFETLPNAAVTTPLATQSGDRISVSIGRIATNLWRIQMANATTGRNWSTAVPYRSSAGSADFVSERPRTAAGSTELPDRTATSFRKARVNGSAARFQPTQRVTMTEGGRAVSTPSGPEARGDGFSVCSYASACGAGSR